MSKNKSIILKKRGEFFEDPLTGLLRNGVRQLIAEAVKADLQELISQDAAFKDEQGHLQVIRNDYLPKQEAQTGIGPVKVRVPKIWDKSSQGIKFNNFVKNQNTLFHEAGDGVPFPAI